MRFLPVESGLMNSVSGGCINESAIAVTDKMNPLLVIYAEGRDERLSEFFTFRRCTRESP